MSDSLIRYTVTHYFFGIYRCPRNDIQHRNRHHSLVATSRGPVLFIGPHRDMRWLHPTLAENGEKMERKVREK